MNKNKLILGSSSKPRQELLGRLKIPFDVAIPDVDETPLPLETPPDLVLRLAELKARKVAEQHFDSIIIGADQVGVLNNQILGKPLTHDNAVSQLVSVSGKQVDFFIGLCLYDAKNQTIQLTLEIFSVIFRHLTHDKILSYLEKEKPYQSAGSLKVEGLGITLVEELRGRDFTALIGLPLISLTQMLEKVGIGPLSTN